MAYIIKVDIEHLLSMFIKKDMKTSKVSWMCDTYEIISYKLYIRNTQP